MQLLDGRLRLSASDLVRHLGCAHLTQLDRDVAEGRRERPAWTDPRLQLIQTRGLAHETSYVDYLRSQSLRVVDLREAQRDTAARQTGDAIRQGIDVIVQARLEDDRWQGWADVLLRVPEPSDLGDWSYEVIDTKLAQETRGGTVLQLCLYSDLLGSIQGRVPERMHVVKPGEGFPRETFRFADFHAYYRLVRRSLETTTSMTEPPATYPAPVEHCDVCDWWQQCDARRRKDDHLCLVAGMTKLHSGEFQRHGVTTLTQLATGERPLPDRPTRGSADAFNRLFRQAQIQHQGRTEGKLIYELLTPEPGSGLARLPQLSAGDLYFDIEADHFAEDGGLEYLLGVVFADENGAFEYRHWWAFDRTQEKAAFVGFMDFVMDRWRRFSDMYIYHYAPYEPAAIKRLTCRHASHEANVDRLLRAERFIDLHTAARQGLRASVESYSLKDLERFTPFIRQVDLRDASAARRRIEFGLESGAASEIDEADRQNVLLYNRDDCLATLELRRWLEERRRELERQGHDLGRPEPRTGDASEAVEERQGEAQQVFEQLTASLPEDRNAWEAADEAVWLLAHQLEYFNREDKCAWWEFFRLHDLDREDLLDERKAIAGLEYMNRVGGTDRCPIHRYRFPPQEAAFSEGGELHEIGGDAIGSVNGIDQVARTIDIKKRTTAADIHAESIFVNERVSPRPLDSSLLGFARSVAEHGVNGTGPFQACRDLLQRRRPRLIQPVTGPLRRPGEVAIDAAVRLANELDAGVLPIQGPPGSGKTYTGARMILSLAGAGKRVGVTAVSHKVIRNLLIKTHEAAIDAGAKVRLVHKARPGEPPTGAIQQIADNDQAIAALGDGAIVGGTAWLWARDQSVETLDYLFVDEAGQMSLAVVLAAGRAARNIVLLGDPQQLEQPQQGVHPEGSEVSALEHVLNGRKTMPEDMGLFLDQTWRLHPAICRFTSELYYDNRLQPRPGLETQAILGKSPFAGSGLFYLPVEHEGNQNSSPEEVEAVANAVESLLDGHCSWIDTNGSAHRLGADDILIVAPYNAQVAAISSRLPDLRVGTVDRFQGQEAPVVIYSATSSSVEDAPRGMSFLFNPNRLNVATSRARCTCILVASPNLTEPECRTPEHMHWANGLCRFRELAYEVAL